ncbi:hypothetical protein SDC9_188993 [bioreactor metagenome]|uniref:Uncharacterized protein n=1 Tax=bioreactor metagenome TaxID=1076179 RepID=A0A645HR53_9ZZZZ
MALWGGSAATMSSMWDNAASFVAARAMWICPICTGLKLPPNTPRRISLCFVLSKCLSSFILYTLEPSAYILQLYANTKDKYQYNIRGCIYAAQACAYALLQTQALWRAKFLRPNDGFHLPAGNRFAGLLPAFFHHHFQCRHGWVNEHRGSGIWFGGH